eukprot:GFUD01033236.1.p1 GENE.GFUD01033236.1~~GFUD01033236.1.p1  ORF type:complete len:288 (-),score=96.81 GFUD01033236.1:191-1054(-)
MAGLDNFKVDSLVTQETKLVGQTLLRAIDSYNKSFHSKHTLCKVQIDPRDNSFTGGVKIHLSIRNCLNLRATLNLGKNGSLKTRLKTQFKFKPRAAEILQVSNVTTVNDVINHIVDQFRIQESPQQFGLYEKTFLNPRCEGTYRRMRQEERPLELSLLWVTHGLAKRKKLVLCDHDPEHVDEPDSDDKYENSNIEELQAMLDTLDQEEEKEVMAVSAKYSQLLQMYKGALDKKRAEMMGSCPNISRTNNDEKANIRRYKTQRSNSMVEQDDSKILDPSKSRTGCSLQ